MARGALSLVKLGAGTLTLLGQSSYSGGTTIGAGTLAIGTSNALPSTGR
jgi:autotransporter-associated beta strand protein